MTMMAYMYAAQGEAEQARAFYGQHSKTKEVRKWGRRVECMR